MKKILPLFILAAILSIPVAAISADQCPTGIVSYGTNIVIPYSGTNYKYMVVSWDGLQDFQQPGFDDSNWFTGDAGFGTLGRLCTLNDTPFVGTVWQLFSDILIRKQFELPFGVTNVQIGLAIDNDAQVFVNGYDISEGLLLHSGCPSRDSFVITVPDNFLNVGANLLAIRGRDFGGESYLDAQITADIPEELVVEVLVDIKPRSCPNLFNVKNKGVLVMAVMGTRDFNVTSIDPASVRLQGVSPIRYDIRDVSAPTDVQSPCDCDSLPPDGLDDLLLFFKRQELVGAIGEEVMVNGASVQLEVSGNLKPAFGGIRIGGDDCILVRNNHRAAGRGRR